MKAILSAFFVLCICLAACTVVTNRPVPPPTAHKHKTKPLPPGQAKKVYGTQSAKPFAPGQQKKKK